MIYNFLIFGGASHKDFVQNVIHILHKSGLRVCAPGAVVLCRIELMRFQTYLFTGIATFQ